MSILRGNQRKIMQSHKSDIHIDKPVLIVDDDVFFTQVLAKTIIDKWSCEVHIAKTYAKTKNYLNKFRYDYHLAICNLELPEAKNGEIVDLIKKANVPMILMSRANSEQLEKDPISMGIIDSIDINKTNAYLYITDLVGRLYKNYQNKILVVDDSNSIAEFISHLLKVQNYQVLIAQNGIQALEILDKTKDIKVVLTDFQMPIMDGIELTIKIREKFSTEKLSVIGISGLENNKLNSNFINNGANDFIIKPFGYNELLSRVNQNIDMLDYLESAYNLANRDFMTNLYNRRYFFTEGKILYESAKNRNSALSICMMDIDHFKQVNDNYGHDCGDVILINFAQTLTKYFDEYMVARLGGEEFAVLFKDIEQTQVIEQLEQFRQTIDSTPISCDDKSISITVSIGVNNDYQENIDTMLKVADQNLYKAKETGRNKVVAG